MAETFETSIPRFVDRLAKLSMEDVALSKNRDKFIQEEIREKVKIGNRLLENNMYTKDFFDKAIKDRRRELAEEASPLGARSGRATMKDGGKFPDLTGDGKVTRADVLKGRGVFEKGGEVDETLNKSSDELRRIAKTKKQFTDFSNSIRKAVEIGTLDRETAIKFLAADLDNFLDASERKEFLPFYGNRQNGRLVSSNDLREKVKQSRNEKQQRQLGFKEGGDVNTQMEMMLGGVEEVDAPMVPDEQMEEDYVDYVVEETLSNEDRNYLIDALEKDDRLSEIFDQVVESATEFTGSGTVEGPGTGKSDSIPARLSDGEFVFTAKATAELGADNLMSMMREAEREADERLQAQEGGLIEEEETVTMPVEEQPVQQDIRVTKETVGAQAAMQEQSDLVDEELKKSMLSTRPYVRS